MSYPALEKVIPSFLYLQYSDDLDLQAFVRTYNELAQGYLDWFNETPLAVYTSPGINGVLLDFIASGIYGLIRPTTSTIQIGKLTAAINSYALNTLAINRHRQIRSGTFEVVNDDIFKRVMTWVLYRGDGLQTTVIWLRKRVARFLFGENGSDIDNDSLQYVSIASATEDRYKGFINSGPINVLPINTRRRGPTQILRGVIVITIQSSIMALRFEQLLVQGWLPVPLQVRFLVKLI